MFSNKTFILFVVSTILLFGCQEDSEDQSSEPTAEKAQEIVENTVNSAASDITSMVQSEGVNALTSLSDLLNQHSIFAGRQSPNSWTKNQLSSIRTYMIEGPVKRVGSEPPRTLNDIKGLYVWNFETEDFDLFESDFFIVQFPSEGSATNNSEFKISQLEYEIIEEDLSTLSAPSIIECYLKIDEITLVEVSYDVKWSITGPKEADVSILISPFTFDFDFVDTFDKSTSLLASISLSDEVITSIDVDVSYETSSKDDPYLIEGSVQYRDLKISGNTDLKEIGLSGDPNTFIDLELQSNDAKIGDIIFNLENVGENQQDYVPYVLYPDGTQQELETILIPILQEIETILADFE